LVLVVASQLMMGLELGSNTW